MNPNVDQYLIAGCGRCPFGGTPDCKVHTWTKELSLLRSIVLRCGLKEEMKWGVPCYTTQVGNNEQNVLIVAAFKDYCALSFLKGVLLKDELQLLHQPGENTQSARFFKFANMFEIIALEDTIKAYIFESIDNEKAGKKVVFDKHHEPIPEEFQNILDTLPDVNRAFFALTPGRQRGYILHFSAPKKAKTRLSRIEKYIPKILEGKGFHD
jgi:uncharacterized protein YdeI (YjbR/CyaY-like superfamily)